MNIHEFKPTKNKTLINISLNSIFAKVIIVPKMTSLLVKLPFINESLQCNFSDVASTLHLCLK